MEKMDIVQARTPKNVKTQANEILDVLGLNMSTYINMSLSQLILKRGIPFKANLEHPAYSDAEILDEVKASMRMEDMPLTDQDVQDLWEIHNGNVTEDESVEQVINEVSNNG